MKKWIHNTNDLEKPLEQFDKEQIEYVFDCYIDVLDDIQDQYDYNSATSKAEAAVNEESIKEDYLIGVDDYDLDRNSFNVLYNILSSVSKLDIEKYLKSL